MHQRLFRAAFAIGLGLVILCLAPNPAAIGQAQESSFTIREQLIIGDDEDAPAEYLLYYPESVRTDSEGNIYVHDALSASVRVFDANGEFVTTIGRRGEGPGEMQEIVSMHMDGDDRLIVVDRISRRLTIFTNMGKDFSVESTIDKGFITSNPLLSLDGTF
ncbi:MAG: 6-bladed beta-propeller [Bacteroidota bacterium]|nr:6-bladed beta-propeller [Bacteroidota bacterium]MDE2834165.1 6-bladed beta-propeller [Bacteroidota bacterium]